MNRVRLLSAAGVALLALAHHPALAQNYYSDIRPLLVESCLGCHTAEGPGWSMEDPAETLQRRQLIAEAVLDRRMPPWIAEEGHQEYLDDPTLGAQVLELVRGWREEGFPEGEPRPDPQPSANAAHGEDGHSFAPSLGLEVLPDEGYLPDQSRPDDYRCFVVDWSHTEPGYVTGFRALPGNLLVAHHVVVYAAAPEVARRFGELEGEGGRPGYQCFGGPVPDRLGDRSEREAYEERYPDGVQELNRHSFWLAHWAPGMDGHRFPEGTGIRVEPGSALIVQMHYYGAEAPGERDVGTQVEFEVAPEVERPAIHFPQTRNEWLAAEQNGSMVIPPESYATYQVSDDLEGLLPYIARVADVDEERIEALEVHSANLHMHAFGHSGRITLRDRHGRVETLLDVPRWDLRWQRDFVFAQPKVFARDALRGASLATECTFRNDTDGTVYGGFGSFDEMCFNFSYIAVRVGEEGL